MVPPCAKEAVHWSVLKSAQWFGAIGSWAFIVEPKPRIRFGIHKILTVHHVPCGRHQIQSDPFARVNLSAPSWILRPSFNDGVVDRWTMAIDPAYGPVDIFHKFCNTKIIQKFLKITGHDNFTFNPLNLILIIF
jgi:hypothetical protein